MCACKKVYNMIRAVPSMSALFETYQISSSTALLRRGLLWVDILPFGAAAFLTAPLWACHYPVPCPAEAVCLQNCFSLGLGDASFGTLHIELGPCVFRIFQ